MCQNGTVQAKINHLITRRKIAVAALNPHAGDGGLLGTEEIQMIGPAVKSASADFDVSGPYAADSVFYRASLGEFDVVVSLYHDQGRTASKYIRAASRCQPCF